MILFDSICLKVFHPASIQQPTTLLWLPRLLAVQVWRMRAYRTEKTVGAAKPLWYLKAALQLSKDTVQRLI